MSKCLLPLSSDGAAVSNTDAVITDSTTIHSGDPFSISLTYSPGSSTHAGNTYVLTDAMLTLEFDSYLFTYSAAAGNHFAMYRPGAVAR